MVEVETLIQAVKQGDVARVTAILDEAPSLASARLPDGESPVMAALYRGHHHVVTALFEAGAEVDVFAAAAVGRAGDLRRELKAPGAVGAYSFDGWTPLHLAAFFGRLETARILLDAGADVDAVSRNSLTNTPLHAATAGKHTEVALLLLEKGAKSGAIDAGSYTPLQIATQNQLEAVVERMTGTRK
ncbi:MAG TPA: ankyrin repeat domain-containing protein [Vicinamibacterales bacterium]